MSNRKYDYVFRIRDMKGNGGYLDAEGGMRKRAEVKEYRGTAQEAQDECNRRAMVFEAVGRGVALHLKIERAK